ncbi:bifunctional Growth factor receptor cysteine-rich domain superfamily/Tyrosine-protein kinase ephrin type A-B receptor-like [Babesia duncani]|uniref:Bifunctional Growth factor receptor cysteine-rich domain superfamily/Tyrosine-protein kinase ephrin type A-B receptor-like n=1 Tax=Babesia duncani TaxID=323732 RepID=A0AAD9UM98_9APIC|nr:bifunctional Growth factor receptor cysteine-rich domain superfamily/Tyrosine-protein kinase ephrin type A-B receptor-like [Babesia duncani]
MNFNIAAIGVIMLLLCNIHSFGMLDTNDESWMHSGTTIRCVPIQYEQCSISWVTIVLRTKGRIFFNENPRIYPNCFPNHSLVLLTDKSLPVYKGDSNHDVVEVCVENAPYSFTKVANIKFKGILKVMGTPIQITGIDFRIKVSILMPKNDLVSGDVTLMYIYMKENDCSSGTYNRLVSQISTFKKVDQGFYTMEYESEKPFMTQAEPCFLCICLWEPCVDYNDYSTPLERVTIEGPLVTNAELGNCIFGNSCLVTIPGRYVTTQPKFMGNVTGINRYLFALDNGMYDIPLQKGNFYCKEYTSAYVDVSWIPFSDKLLSIYIGRVMVHSTFRGELYSMPFGKRTLDLTIVNTLSCTNYTFYIFKNKVTSDASRAFIMHKEDIMIKKIVNASKIDIDFVIEASRQYTIRYCNDCTGIFNCLDKNGNGQTALFAILEPQDNGKVLQVEWMGQKGPSEILGKAFALCWRDLNRVILNVNDVTHYAVEVGKLLIASANIRETFTCWLGSICNIMLHSTIEGMEFYLGSSCSVGAARVEFEHGDSLQTRLFTDPNANGIILLTGYIQPKQEFIGTFKVCVYPTNLQFGNVNVSITRVSLPRRVFYVKDGANFNLDYNHIVKGDSFIALAPECGQDLNVMNTRFKISQVVVNDNGRASSRRICWCNVIETISCINLKDYKISIGTLVTDGFALVPSSHLCNAFETCQIDILYKSFANVAKYEDPSALFNQKLYVFKESGPHKSKASILIYLGKRFNIHVKGHEIDSNTRARLALDKTCFNANSSDSIVSVLMSPTPDVIYDDNGTRVLAWLGVRITRKPDFTPNNLLAKNLGLIFETKRTIYLCISTGIGYHAIGTRYIVGGPKLLKVDNFTSGMYKPQIPQMDLKHLVREHSLLAISFVTPIKDPAFCESFDWSRYNAGVSFSLHRFLEHTIKLPMFLTIDRLLLCWCGGTACNTFGEFKTSLKLYQNQGPLFQTVPLAPGGTSITFTGEYLTSRDEIRFVDLNTHCGNAPSSSMSLGMIFGKMDPATSSSHVSKIRDALGAPKVFKSGIINTWQSFPVKLVFPSVSRSSIYYKVCYCSFYHREQCNRDKDFGDWMGAIADASMVEDAEMTFLLRIIISPSSSQDQHGFCGLDDDSLNLGSVATYRLTGTRSRIRSFIQARQETYSIFEGFFFEACYTALELDSKNNRRVFKQMVAREQGGVYSKQSISVKHSVNDTIVIRGNGLMDFTISKVAILKTTTPCGNHDYTQELASAVTSDQMRTSNIVVFTSVMLDRVGFFKMCILIDIRKSGESGIASAKWYDAGHVISRGYFFRTLSDLVSLPLLDAFVHLPKQQLSSCDQGTARVYQLCSLLKERVIIVADCNNRLWAVVINGEDGVVEKDKAFTQRLEIGNGIETRRWLLCKEMQDPNPSLYLLGETAIMVLELPLNTDGPLKILLNCLHNLVNPLDLFSMGTSIFISDGFTRTLVELTCIDKGGICKCDKLVLVGGVYWIAMQTLTINKTIHLLALDPGSNTISRYKFVLINGNLVLDFVSSYTNGSASDKVKIGSLDRPSSMDLLMNSPQGTKVTNLLFVAENITGRVIVFQLDDVYIRGYKVMHILGVITRINVDHVKRMLLIALWRTYLGSMEQYILYRPIGDYVDLDFFYNIAEKYQSKSVLNFKPICKGDVFEFFDEDVVEYGLATLGLSLDSGTGVISGILEKTGKYTFTIIGGNALKQITRTITISSSCPPAFQVNPLTNECELCPIGTFRNEQPDDKCVACVQGRKNSTTKLAGGVFQADCQCASGYYLLSGNCTPCQEGTFKSEVGDSVCSGTCSNNMISTMVESFLGNIKQLDLYKADDGTIKPFEKSLANQVCLPCKIGFYCPGKDAIPISCGYGKTTRDRYSFSPDACICDVGFGWVQGTCVMCSQFGYKDTVANEPCSMCPGNESNNLLVPNSKFEELDYYLQTDWLDYIKQDPDGSKFSHLDKIITSTNQFGATSSNQCQYCVAGYYFDYNEQIFRKCPYDFYCPGLDSLPIPCGPYAITLFTMSTNALDCLCPAGFGNIPSWRSPINNGVICNECPLGHFQHLVGTDGPCIACPKHSTTRALGAKSLFDCIPDDGYFLKQSPFPRQEENENIEPGHLEHLMLGIENVGVTQQCFFIKDTFEASKFDVMRRTQDDCFKSCQENIYCRGYIYNGGAEFAYETTTPFISNHTVQYNGLVFLKTPHYPCTLLLFDIKYDLALGLGILFCKVNGPGRDLNNVPLPCPLDHYCMGLKDPIPCPKFSKTLVTGLFSAATCLCIPGYEPCTNGSGCCKPCEMGWYKEEIGNVACTRCPDKMKTATIGSVTIAQCACAPGHYARPLVDLFPKYVYLRHFDDSVTVANEGLKNIKSYMHYMEIDVLDLDIENVDSVIFLSEALFFLPLSTKQESQDFFFCDKCTPKRYCPGGWTAKLDKGLIHNYPYKCPFGSSVPLQSSNATSIKQCLCLPGYKINMDEYKMQDTIPSSNGDTAPETWLMYKLHSPMCSRCDGAMYKEGLENSSCSGRCMQYSTNYGGSVSKNQCFCHYGRYMVQEFPGHFVCAPCMDGAICPGGLRIEAIEKLQADTSFKDITLMDHTRPQPMFGYFPAYMGFGEIVWTPMKQRVVPVESLSAEVFDFHPCTIEERCDGQFGDYCSAGATGYLCSLCSEGYDSVWFRGPCIKCRDVMGEVLNYLSSRSCLWVFTVLLMLMSRYKLLVPCVLMKIWMEFFFSMAPYGILHQNSPSSLKQYAIYYKMVFGYQQRIFSYLRLRCILPRLDLCPVKWWYLQRGLQLLQPMLDACIMFIISFTFYMLCRAVSFILFTFKRWRRGRGIDRNMSSMDTDAGSGSHEATKSAKWVHVRFGQCCLVLYYQSFQPLCQELLQMVWCVDVRYKDNEPISVLLHMPLQVCNVRDAWFANTYIAAVLVLTLLVLSSTVGLMSFMIKQRRKAFLFTCGHRLHFRGWDAFMFLKRTLVAAITIVQTHTMSIGPAEIFRALAGLLLATLATICHMLLSPFTIRSDNLFNRFELASLCFNNLTAFLILVCFLDKYITLTGQL